MFYSSAFLARKGPLGTVWIAAHLQNRLKKSHYASVPIPETVEEIMCPAVPIALRLSGHLLLGVVRIYSKKVDYLFQDCNTFLGCFIKAFTRIDIDLPKSARQAPIHSITLPETFNLDALDLDDDIYLTTPDNHQCCPEEITLADQIPVERESYVTVTFDEDVPIDTLNQELFPDMDVRPMAEDNLHVHPNSSGCNMVFQDPRDDYTEETVPTPQPAESSLFTDDSGPTDQTEIPKTHAVQTDSGLSFGAPSQSNHMEVINGRNSDTSYNQNVPEIEVLRDLDDIGSEQIFPVMMDHGNHKAEERNRVSNENLFERTIPLASDEPSLPFQMQPDLPASVDSENASDTTTAQLFGHRSPNLAVRSTPPVQQRNVGQRKRKKQFCDESTVLPIKFLKKTLKDCRDILRNRRDLPYDALTAWRLQNRLKKERVFLEPLTNGLSIDLCNVFRRDYIASKSYLVEETTAEPSVSRSIPTAESSQEHEPSPSVLATEKSPGPLVLDNHPPVIGTSPAPTAGLSFAPATETFTETNAAFSCSLVTEICPKAQVSPPASTPVPDMEIEHVRCYQDPSSSSMLSGIMPSGRDNITPTSNNNLSPVSESLLGTTGTGMLSTPESSASTGTNGSPLESPTYTEEPSTAGTFGHPDNLEFNSAENEDLSFLETENKSPAGPQGSPGVGMFSVRTRSVARYLKNHSSITPSALHSYGDLSVNKILRGKARKSSARMFYETLVLKSYGLVDVQQEEPYGDITLKMTPKFSKAEF